MSALATVPPTMSGQPAGVRLYGWGLVVAALLCAAAAPLVPLRETGEASRVVAFSLAFLGPFALAAHGWASPGQSGALVVILASFGAGVFGFMTGFSIGVFTLPFALVLFVAGLVRLARATPGGVPLAGAPLFLGAASALLLGPLSLVLFRTDGLCAETVVRPDGVRETRTVPYTGTQSLGPPGVPGAVVASYCTSNALERAEVVSGTSLMAAGTVAAAVMPWLRAAGVAAIVGLSLAFGLGAVGAMLSPWLLPAPALIGVTLFVLRATSTGAARGRA